MMRICSIASGSSGNCTYITDEKTGILIDTGVSLKKINAGLDELGTSLDDISAILITHEHIDHVGGLGVLLRKKEIPVYATGGTIRGIRGIKSLGSVNYDLFENVKADEVFSIGTLDILPVATPHDSIEPCMYRVFSEDMSAAVMTDLGYFDEYITDHLRGVNMLLLEANHDVGMVETGPYPYSLKQRILGSGGHLSNENCGKLLDMLLHDDYKGTILGHLSKENNYDKLAYESVRMEIDMSKSRYMASDFDMKVAPPVGVVTLSA